MVHFSFFYCSFCILLLFLLIPHQNSISTDLVDQTCHICASKSPTFNYNFCSTSLQSIPISHAANLQGLAVVAMELALENATSTISAIKKMLDGGVFDPFALKCLDDCLGLYSDAVNTLINSVGAFLSQQYGTANVGVSSVMEATNTCEGGFVEKEGEVSPMTKENNSLFELCGIALCIFHLLTLNPAF